MLFRMILPAFLVVVWLMGTAGSPVCPPGCRKTNHTNKCITHVSDLGESSVAPWKLELSEEPGIEYPSFLEAKCTTCRVENMVAKPIFISIMVFKRARENNNQWCKCPYQLSVGCTCVPKQ